MNGSLSQFKAAQRRKADRKDKSSNKFGIRHSTYTTSEDKPEYNFREISDDELQVLKKTIKTNLEKERQKNFIIVLISSIITAALIYFFVLT